MLDEFHSAQRVAREEGSLFGVVVGMIGGIRSGGSIRSAWSYCCTGDDGSLPYSLLASRRLQNLKGGAIESK